MNIYTEPKGLLDALRAVLSPYRRVIAIDGVDGSGKSTLARNLAKLTGWQALHLDDYLQKDQGTYVQHVNVGQLRADIQTFTSHVLVEGVCVLDVLTRIAEPPAAHIYVKRLDRHGFWLDEDESCFECSAEKKIADISTQVESFIEHCQGLEGESGSNSPMPSGLSEFRAEVIRYHAAARPFERATLIYERVESDA